MLSVCASSCPVPHRIVASPIVDPKDRSLLLTTRQVSELINCGDRTVWRWSRSGRMPAPVRIGVAVRYRRDEIERWIEAGCPLTEGSPLAQGQ